MAEHTIKKNFQNLSYSSQPLLCSALSLEPFVASVFKLKVEQSEFQLKLQESHDTKCTKKLNLICQIDMTKFCDPNLIGNYDYLINFLNLFYIRKFSLF